VEPCNKDKEEIYAKEGKGVSIVEGRVERDAQVHSRIIEKRYIRPLKLPQMALVLFVGMKDGKKYMIQDYRYLNK